MKKLATLGLGLGLFFNTFASDITFMEDQLGDYAIKFKGSAEAYFKSQDDYETALDSPDIDVFAREGADERDEQFGRYELDLAFYSGKLGETTFFNYLSLEVDPNDPDDADGALILEHAFVMWRPEIKGQRPFGLTIGQSTSKQTINAAYSNKFSGDFEDDFVAYSGTGLREKPMIGLDMYFSKDTGIGYQIVKGSSDLLQSGVRYDDDYSITHVIWGESKVGNFGFNAAYQYALGARGDYDINNVDGGTTSKDADYDYETGVFNTQLTYSFELANGSSLMPFIGYQSLNGEEAQSFDVLEIDWQDETPDAKEVGVEIQTMGIVYNTSIREKKVKFAAEYSNVESEDYDGLGGVSDGYIDYGVESVELTDFTTGKAYSGGDGKFLGITGDSTAISSLSGADAMYHIEASVDMTENLTITVFYNGLISTSVNTDPTAEDISEITEVLENELGYTDGSATLVAAELGALKAYGFSSAADLITALSAYGVTDASSLITFVNTNGFDNNSDGQNDVTTEDIAEYLADSLADSYDTYTKWTDSSSVGLSVRYTF